MAIVLFTDFGSEGPYLGQMESVIGQIAPDCKVINLLSNAPIADPLLSAYLLASMSKGFPDETVFLAVVDPGVGGDREALVLEADGKFYVGPDNGLLNTVSVHARQSQWYRIVWSPAQCSASFHGRDIFAPVAARLANQSADPLLQPIDRLLSEWPKDIERIIYFDHYGNAMTGIRYRPDWEGKKIIIKGRSIEQANTFSDVKEGELFWYKNSSDLIEIAANRENAKKLLQLQLGDAVGC